MANLAWSVASTMTSYGIEVRGLWKRYIVREGFRRRRVVEALRGISFSVRRGTVHALLGPNGAGKTTTVRILATLLLPDAGEARVMGYDVVREAKMIREHIGVVLDVSKGFYMSLTGYENLVFYALLKGYSLTDARRRAKEVLELVGLEAMGASRRPYYTYSLGMRARLAIAKALLSDPDVLLLDEPTLGLDVESARMVRSLIQELARMGKTILVTGHNMYEIELVSNEVTIINKGRVVASGSPRELKERLGLVYRVALTLHGVRGERFVEELRKSVSVEKFEAIESGDSVSLTLYVRGSRGSIMQAVLEVVQKLNASLRDLSIVEPSLEDAYLAVIAKG